MARILVVDDEASIRRIHCLILQDEGHVVTQADSGENALRLCCAQEFDLVITDLTMKEMTGLELLDTLRERGITTPVILISALNEHYRELFSSKFSFERVLPKPADLVVITTAVSQVLARQ